MLAGEDAEQVVAAVPHEGDEQIHVDLGGCIVGPTAEAQARGAVGAHTLGPALL